QTLDGLLRGVERYGGINTFYPEVSFLKGELCTALSVQCLTQGNLKEAGRYLDLAESTLFRSSLFYRMAGILSGLDGDLSGAEMAFSEALRWEPQNYWVYESMALTYLHHGEQEQALEALSQALRMPYPDPAILRTAMNIYMRLDRHKEFLSALGEYMKLPDSDQRVLTRCLPYLKQKGDTILAEKIAKRAGTR
ncbi:MAG: hypothetical protein IT583_07375, partial [Verrucomicrobia bacterium]|nr:hypothetical protein [Verrucomicrobiota bacterium]